MSIMTRPPAGWEHRPCLGTMRELWYGPDDDGPAAYEEPADQKAWREQRAKQVCAMCPFVDYCLAAELELPACHQWGVRGGMTAAERRRVLRDRAERGAA